MERSSARCRACDHHTTWRFYEAPGVPTNDVLVMESHDEARAYPKGDIELAVCRQCGFVQNSKFDATLVQYSPRCEESQACSGTFNAFAARLAERIFDTYELDGRTVLEIGCGKGEFLAELCRERPVSGIGVDPAYRGPAQIATAHGHLRFVRDVIEDHADLVFAADLILCRHTLEHIAQPLAFMRQLRDRMRDDIPVVIEVPAAESVFERRAFWDIYYEHCSYFGGHALAALVTATGFNCEQTYTEFGGQYLLMHARSLRGAVPAPDASTFEPMPALCERFETAFRDAVDIWETVLLEARAGEQTVALWGGGSKAVALLTTLAHADGVAFVVDINPRKQNRYLPGTGHPIVAPAALRDRGVDVLIILNPAYEAEIRANLQAMGLEPEIHCLA